MIWNLDKAQRAIRFFETVLHLNGGDFEGKPFKLELWQKFCLGSLMGWYGADGYRRFRSAFLEIGKGNGKSPFVAGIGLYMMTADGEERAECYSAAAVKEQAQILFRDAVAMVDQSPDLSCRVKKSGAAGREWNLAYLKTRSFFRPISSESKGRGKSGLRVHYAALDELHEHPTDAMVNFLRMGTKGRKQPLIAKITNSGVDRKSVCWNEHDYAVRIVKGLVFDDTAFSYVCALDKGDDFRNESVWPKANPNLGVSIPLQYLRDLVHEAAGMPSKQSIVKRLNFCEWVDAENPWIDGEKWRSCIGAVDSAKLAGRKCYGGLDLSGKNAFTAYTRVYAPAEGEKRSVAITTFWTPEDGLRKREEMDLAPYTQWVEEGFLEKTPGGSIDYAYAAKRIADDVEKNGLVELAFDRWRIDDFKRELDDITSLTYVVLDFGVEDKTGAQLILRPHGQGFQDMGPAVDELETRVINGTLLVEENPVMNMCSANAVLTTDPAGSRKFDKRKASGRIDGVISLAMANRCESLAPRRVKSFWE